jgi:type II secretory pathway pseudopilin PulG
MIVVAIIGTIAAIAIPNLISSRMASNETSAIAGLRAYLGAQGTFQRVDRYAIGKSVFANKANGAGFSDLFEVGYTGGTPTVAAIKLIDVSFAKASVGMANTVPKSGYIFDDLTADFVAGNYDYNVSCGLAATPKTHGKGGINSYVVDLTGSVYKSDLTSSQTVPPTTYPDLSGGKWLPVGS